MLRTVLGTAVFYACVHQGGKVNRRNRGRAGKVKSGAGNRPLAVVAFRLPFWL
jgi:phage gpG-like protein